MKRFDLVCSLDGGGMGEPEESPEGDWVRFEDVKAEFAAERKRCIAAIIIKHANGSYKFTHREECVEAIFALGDDQ